MRRFILIFILILSTIICSARPNIYCKSTSRCIGQQVYNDLELTEIKSISTYITVDLDKHTILFNSSDCNDLITYYNNKTYTEVNGSDKFYYYPGYDSNYTELIVIICEKLYTEKTESISILYPNSGIVVYCDIKSL